VRRPKAPGRTRSTWSFDANQQAVDWQANGAGSVLDLSKLDAIQIEGDARFGRFHVIAAAGGKVDLSHQSVLGS
jgi:hypothetical protein